MFLAAALIVPVIITLTYNKSGEGLPIADVDLTQYEETETEYIPEDEDETVIDEETGPVEAEETEEDISYPRVYASDSQSAAVVDRYTLYSPAVDSEWSEEELRVLGPVTEEETTAAPAPAAANNSKNSSGTVNVPATKTTDTPKTADTVVTTGDAPKNSTGKYVGCDAKTVKVYIRSTGKYETMLMGDYIVGAVAAEMPARFGIEALKTQAVASRTYAIYKMQSSAYYHDTAHGSQGADVCTSSGHCQAYLSYESALASWGNAEYTKNIYDKIKRAVLETSGVIASYKGEPVLTVFHASSYGSTDSVTNVWGSSLPCLIGVSTPESSGTICHTSKEVFTSAEVKRLVLSKVGNASFSSDPSGWMKITLNNNGRVKTLQVGSASLGGTVCKALFGLASTNFKVSYNKSTDKFTFEVYGWGHGVGMSQYGAAIYADQGKSYEFIIKHYYSGCSLTIWNG